MVTIHFTENLKRHVDVQSMSVQARVLSEAMNEVYNMYPKLKSYLVDEAGHLLTHMTIFIDEVVAQDRKTFSDPLQENSEIYIMQALSGG